MALAKEHLDKLEYLKECVIESYTDWKPNAVRFNDFMNFVFNTSLSVADVGKLNALSKPTIEFNILEAFISRLRGEFADHDPDMKVGAAEGLINEQLTPELIRTIEVVEAHIRDIFAGAANDGLEYKFYTDCLAGGYSVGKVFTDYVNELSFEQKIMVERVFDPTLTGFDPLARKTHKGDGRYAFELFPKTKEDLEAEFGADAVKNLSFTRAIDGFSWSYQNGEKKIALLCDFYLKVNKRKKIVKLTNGHTILESTYKKVAEQWIEQGIFEVIPEVVSTRWTNIETIERYLFCQNKVLKHEKTPYKYLPLVFIDGNSIYLSRDNGGATHQMTRPYVYQAMGIQKLKNFAGQTIGAEINGMVQHKFKAAIESIPEQYLETYTDVQNASTLIYYAFNPDNPEQPLPPPMEIQRTPTPPLVQEVFLGSDRVTQSILGTYDAELGMARQDMSGEAIKQGALHASPSSKPYLVGYINGCNRIAEIIIDLLPKFYVTPRSIPIRRPNGIRDYQIINQPNNPQSIDMKYDPKSLQVRIEVGVNSSLQKQMALDQIIALMNSSEMFAKFINSTGLEVILDNIDIRGIEDLKLKAGEFMKAEQEAAEAAKNQPTPEQQLIMAEVEIETQRIDQKREEAQGNLAIKSAQVANEQEKTQIEFLRLLSEVENDEFKNQLEVEKVDAEFAHSAMEIALDAAKAQRENLSSD